MAWTPELEAEYQALEAQYGNQPAVPPAIADNLNANQKLLEAQAAAIGKAAGEAVANAPKEEKMQQMKMTSSNVINNAIDKAINKSDWWSTGFGAKSLANVGGTDAYNLQKTIDAIRSNIGFDKLQQMREASPTGGALGQVAVQELEMLQSALGSLDIGQSEEQLDATLAAIKKHYANLQRELQGGSTQVQPEAPTVDWRQYFGGK